VRESIRRSTVEKSDHWHRRLLRVGAEWPSDGRAAEKADELAPSHCLPQALDGQRIGLD
jgi:hypothetical protein